MNARAPGITAQHRPANHRSDDDDRRGGLRSCWLAQTRVSRCSGRLLAGFANLLWAVARAHRLDDADCADAVQTAWLRLLENVDRITDPERLGAWLSTTVRRRCLRLIRRSGREYVSDAEAFADIPEPRTPEMDAGLLRNERDAELWTVFERIPDRCRRLLRVLMADPAPSYQEVSGSRHADRQHRPHEAALPRTVAPLCRGQ